MKSFLAGAALVAVRNFSLEKLFFGCGNILPKLEFTILVTVRIFNIAATPKGVANYVIPLMLRGEEARFAHLIPSLCFRNPQGGVLLFLRLGRALLWSLCDVVLSEPL